MNFIKHLKLKVPPPILTVVFIFSNYLSTYFFYSFQFKYQELISLLIFILGLIFIILASRLYYKFNTSINPLKPYNCSFLITNGVYSISRNPIYLGYLLFLSSSSIYFSTLFCFIIIYPYILYINYFQIESEEEALQDLFGHHYDIYKSKVRKWI